MVFEGTEVAVVSGSLSGIDVLLVLVRLLIVVLSDLIALIVLIVLAGFELVKVTLSEAGSVGRRVDVHGLWAVLHDGGHNGGRCG